MQVFERLTGPCFFECPKALLVHWLAYLGSWALVAFINVLKFLLDSSPFLLEAIEASSSNSFPSQEHLKLFREFFPLVATCLAPFEQLVERGTNPLQETISKRLHNHFFSSIISNMSFDVHQAQLRSYARLGTWVRLFVHLVIHVFICP